LRRLVRREQAQQQVVEIAEQPAASDTELVRLQDLRPMAQRELAREGWKIDPGVDRQLQRAPEPAVYFDQEALAGAPVLLVFQHRDAVPAQRPQHADRLIAERVGDRLALAQHAHPAGGRLLAKPAMSEVGNELAAIEQDEHAEAGAAN